MSVGDVRAVRSGALRPHYLAAASQLNLDICLSGGQTFSWSRFREFWCNVLEGRLVLLSTKDGAVYFWTEDEEEAAPLTNVLRRYFRLDTDLDALYSGWLARDELFAAPAQTCTGVRLLAQPAYESLLAFICSQNNGIRRITSMVATLKQCYGRLVAIIDDASSVYSFPRPEDLMGSSVEPELRRLGFGYRAAYFSLVSDAIVAGDLDLSRLEAGSCDYVDAWKALMAIKGVGPKVADCVALTGLGHMQAVPIDTHIWRVARTRYVKMPTGLSLTLNNYRAIGDHFRRIHGSAAGWAHLVLFAAQIYAKTKNKLS